MSRPGRRALTALTLAVAVFVAPLVTPSPAAAAPTQIQLLTINDFHGRLEQDTTAGIPGAARLAGLVDEVSGELPTSFAAAGDLIGASPFVSAVAQDAPTIEVLNAMGLQASAVGNHEFDKGATDLLDRVDPLSDWDYLGANVYDGATGERILPAYSVEEVGEVTVAYVGTVTQETPSLVSPDGIEGLEFRDPVAETEAVAAELKDGDEANGEADVVVALAHEGAALANIGSPEDLAADPVFGEFVAMSDDVDAIFSGHTHQPYAFEVDIPGSDRTRAVVSAQEYGKALGRVTLTVDPDAGTVEVGVVELLDPAEATPDPDIAELVADAVADSAELGAEQVGTIDADIVRGGTPPGADRGVESVMGNFVADAQLAGTSDPGRGGAQIALMNAGGLREDLLVEAVEGRPGDGEGVVTYGEAFAVQPFANDVVTKSYTGAELRQVLEEQWQPAGASRPVLWMGISEGFTYTYDPGAPRGYHVNPDSMMLNGTVIDPEATYRVTVNSFLAAGGDNFATLAGGTDPVTTGDNDLTMLVDHFRSFDGPAVVDTEPRTAAAVPTDPDITPFPTVTEMVARQFADFAGREPTPEEAYAWEVGIYQGNRTFAQMVLELQTVELRTPAAQVTRIYLGLFQRPPSAADLDYWVGQMDAGRSIDSVAAFFAGSAEFRARYGDADDTEFVTLVYQNVLGRNPGDAEVAYWVGELGRGVPRGRVFLLFSESPENRAATAPHLRVIDLALSMVDRAPTGTELRVVIDGLADGTATLTDLIDAIRTGDEYAARVTGG